jgi:hypothetical protein
VTDRPEGDLRLTLGPPWVHLCLPLAPPPATLGTNPNTWKGVILSISPTVTTLDLWIEYEVGSPIMLCALIDAFTGAYEAVHQFNLSHCWVR